MPADPRPTGTGEPHPQGDHALHMTRKAAGSDETVIWFRDRDPEDAAEIARLRAEVEKLEEERDEARALSVAIILHQEPSRTISWLTEEARRLLTIEARAARLEEALRGLRNFDTGCFNDEGRMCGADGSWHSESCAAARDALNPEGGEHGDD